MSQLSKVFVIMPFSEDFHALYDKLKEEFKDEYEFTNAGDMDNQQNIIADIVRGIHSADVIIADLTGLNANVFYELGLAHAMNKKVIIITQDIDELPFDIKSYRANQYSLLFHKLPALIEELRKLLNGAVDDSIRYGNPVTDYVIPSTPKEETASPDKALSVSDSSLILLPSEPETEGEKGFLDYITEIQEFSERLTAELYGIGDEMKEMSNSVDVANLEIRRVKGNSGSVNASFIKKTLQRLTGPMDTFSEKLRNHVAVIGSGWNIIENAYLGMLESRFIEYENNQKDLPKVKQALVGLKANLLESENKIRFMIDSVNSCSGVERRLNKSINMMTTELNGYLTMSSIMVSSLDRLIARTDLVYKGETKVLT